MHYMFYRFKSTDKVIIRKVIYTMSISFPEEYVRLKRLCNFSESVSFTPFIRGIVGARGCNFANWRRDIKRIDSLVEI